MLYHGIMSLLFSRTCPNGIDKINPEIAGKEVKSPISKLVAPNLVKNTGINGSTELASPTPSASSWTFLKFLLDIFFDDCGVDSQRLDRDINFEIKVFTRSHPNEWG